jgi:transglutaminase-like putative cysteine protease
MLYDIRLRVAYEYESPTASNRNLVRIFPLELPGVQRPIVTELSISPKPGERSAFCDFFGNPVQDVFIREPHSELEIRMVSRVDRLATLPPAGDGPLGELGARVAEVHSLEPESPHHFLGRSPRVRPSTMLREWAMTHLRSGMATSEAVRGLGRALRAHMAFDPEATSVETTHEEAFELRRGVCQDFTHILIAALRSVGVPAGYVSGCARSRRRARSAWRERTPCTRGCVPGAATRPAGSSTTRPTRWTPARTTWRSRAAATTSTSRL